MVPVPDEFVVDVMQYVARLVARASVIPWTKESIEQFFDETEEINRALLSFVARSTVAGKDVSDEDAAESLELSVREINALSRDINTEAQRNKNEPLLGLREAQVQLRSGRVAQRRLFNMNESVARMIRSYERASLPNVEVGGAEAVSDVVRMTIQERPAGGKREYSDVVQVFEPNSSTLPKLSEYVQRVLDRRTFITELANAEIRGSQSSTLLGELWSLADPCSRPRSTTSSSSSSAVERAAAARRRTSP